MLQSRKRILPRMSTSVSLLLCYRREYDPSIFMLTIFKTEGLQEVLAKHEKEHTEALEGVEALKQELAALTSQIQETKVRFQHLHRHIPCVNPGHSVICVF